MFLSLPDNHLQLTEERTNGQLATLGLRTRTHQGLSTYRGVTWDSITSHLISSSFSPSPHYTSAVSQPIRLQAAYTLDYILAVGTTPTSLMPLRPLRTRSLLRTRPLREILQTSSYTLPIGKPPRGAHQRLPTCAFRPISCPFCLAGISRLLDLSNSPDCRSDIGRLSRGNEDPSPIFTDTAFRLTLDTVNGIGLPGAAVLSYVLIDQIEYTLLLFYLVIRRPTDTQARRDASTAGQTPDPK